MYFTPGLPLVKHHGAVKCHGLEVTDVTMHVLIPYGSEGHL
jgi:hypothetical protein